ncbi:MAG: hypothetical protein COA58_16750 [Bacteroidetes bacterium]|nr:MAG: hypothetical protein COA58_16750 [Bacteroidota bacterium]
MNSLQAALNNSQDENIPAPVKKSKPKVKKQAKKSSRADTVLVGGHFAPDVKKQLRMIAAEEGTTNQALLEEALNLLFRKKGKKAIL